MTKIYCKDCRNNTYGERCKVYYTELDTAYEKYKVLDHCGVHNAYHDCARYSPKLLKRIKDKLHAT